MPFVSREPAAPPLSTPRQGRGGHIVLAVVRKERYRVRNRHLKGRCQALYLCKAVASGSFTTTAAAAAGRAARGGSASSHAARGCPP